ncbi:MAG: hypothetical protein U0167_03710 [bacterium]
MRRASLASLAGLAVLAGLASLAPGQASAAGSALLGGFQPIAVEDGARAAWINPAAISETGGQLVAEGVFLETPEGYRDLSFLTIAASAPGRAYGWQLERKDLVGVPDWTLVAANVIGQKSRAKLGSTIEWRGGVHRRFDATLGALAPLGRNLRIAAAVEDLFAADVDGVAGARNWRAGAAARGHLGYLSWDWRGVEHEKGRNIFGVGVDLEYLRVSGSLDDQDTWTAEVRLVVADHVGGVGQRKPDEGFGSRFVTTEIDANPGGRSR